MKNERNFYDIMSSKFSEREIPFEEENWKAMRAMIDESRSGKKRVLWLVASLSLLLCAGGAFGIYEWNHNGAQSKMVYADAASTNNPSKTISASNEQASAKASDINKTTNNTTLSNNHETTIRSVNANSPTINQASVSASTQRITAIVPDRKNVKHSRHNSIAANEATVNSNINALSNDMGSSNAVAQGNGIADNGQSNLTLDKKESESPNHVPVSANTVQSSNPTSVKGSASVTGKTSIRKIDSIAAANALPQRFSNEPRIFMGKTNLFSVDAAIEYSGGWEEGVIVQGQGVNVMAGMGYSHYLGGRLFLKTGLQFSTFGNMSPLTYSYQHNVGHVFYDSVITTKRLYFLKLPVQVEYFVGRNKRFSIGLGGTLWYLVGSSGYATTYQQEDNNPPTNMITYSQNTPLAGYNKVNASVQATFRYVISRKFSVYIIPFAELTNMKDNSFFGEKIIERTHGADAMLSYNLN